MSWSASVQPTVKTEIYKAINEAASSPDPLDEHMGKQFEAAKEVARKLVETVPGPKVSVTMSGHANGVGEVEKPGWSNDFITVTVSQVTK